MTDYSKWINALQRYNEVSKNATAAQDSLLSKVFRGSKLTARFIYRSGCKTVSESNYEKDCTEFGKAKIDQLVETVLIITKK